MAIVQWNCNGFFCNLAEIQMLKTNIDPEIICLQETHLKTNQTTKLTGYEVIRKDRDHNHASGGVGILIKDDRYWTQINLNTDLEAVAIELQNTAKITICNIYIPPNRPYSYQEIENLIRQLPKPFIFLGDFNSNHVTWGCSRTTERSRILENLIDNTEVVLLNDGTSTHFCSRNGTSFAIDLAFCSASAATNYTWETLPTIQGGGHTPIKINHLEAITNAESQMLNKWNLKQANWDLYRLWL